MAHAAQDLVPAQPAPALAALENSASTLAAVTSHASFVVSSFLPLTRANSASRCTKEEQDKQAT
jgi:hypothetical protein